MTARHLPPPLMLDAVRHLHADGWTFHHTEVFGVYDLRWIKDGRCIIWHSPWLRVYKTSLELVADLRPTSLCQAIDHLVTAGILPAAMHSLAPVPAASVLEDADGDRWTWQPHIACYRCDIDRSETRTREQIEAAYGPVREVAP